MLRRPLSIYNNWSAYDELSDNVELTEALAAKQLAALLRLRAAGVQFDGYLMDAFWYDPEGAYRLWRKPHWPQGPDRWLAACAGNDLKPGLWFSGNTLCKLKAAPEWQDSLDADGWGMCLFHGGFLPHWLETMRLWHERGVRMFKLDFFNFGAAPAVVRNGFLPSEIRARNIAALREGLQGLRDQCPDIVLLGYNGFDEAGAMAGTDFPFRKTIDPRWLEVFDAMYCGDPRPSDVPAMNFWRSMDVYSDHMVRVFERNGFPLARIDNCGFMIGTTGTCYGRKTAAWQGMLILSLARGGWANVYHGNLDLLDAEQAAWFAHVQALFLRLQTCGRFATWGAIPGEGRPYGYLAEDADGALLTVVNPAQAEEVIRLPLKAEGRILFHDGGYKPTLGHGQVTLGAEQMAVVGTGRYRAASFDMGLQKDVRTPASFRPLPGEFLSTGKKEIMATINPPREGHVRVVLQQRDQGNRAKRSTGGAPPHGTTLERLLSIDVAQGTRMVTMTINYDKAIWSGLAWAVGEFRADTLACGTPVSIRCSTKEAADITLTARLFQTTYADE